MMRLDGTVKSVVERDELVRKFQQNTSISVFLLTTQVSWDCLTWVGVSDTQSDGDFYPTYSVLVIVTDFGMLTQRSFIIITVVCQTHRSFFFFSLVSDT